MEMHPTPAVVVAMVCAGLQPTVPGITPEKLTKAIKSYDVHGKLPEEKQIKFLKIQEVAKILAVTERTIHRLCANGKLTKVKLAVKTARITSLSLNNYIQSLIDGGTGHE